MKKAFVMFLAASVLFLAALAQSQNDGRIHVPEAIQQGQDTRAVPIRTGNPVDEQQMQRMREMRMEQMKKDTGKLYQLTGELKQYIDKNGSNFLSVDMIKKAEGIEKLAHSVKQKRKENQ
jgi:hypothetical protein